LAQNKRLAKAAARSNHAQRLLRELQSTNRQLRHLEEMREELREELKEIRESLNGLNQRFRPQFVDAMAPWGPPPSSAPTAQGQAPMQMPMQGPMPQMPSQMSSPRARMAQPTAHADGVRTEL